jgi:predicted nucleotidyltransferase
VKHLQSEQLRDLESLAKELGNKRLVLIGASALDLQLDLAWRRTFDLDLAIAVPVEGYPQRIKEWNRDSRNPIAWTGPSGTHVDLIPAGPGQVAAGFVDIPGTTNRMSLIGFRHVFARANPLPDARHSEIGIAPIPVIALLKMVSYQERPHERERDLEDLAYILERYPDAADDRRYSDEVFEAGVTSEAAGAFVLGTELGTFLDDRELRSVRSLTASLIDESDGGHARTRMLRQGPPNWNRSPEELLERVRAFERGLNG